MTTRPEHFGRQGGCRVPPGHTVLGSVLDRTVRKALRMAQTGKTDTPTRVEAAFGCFTELSRC